jgi:hypothetical protein
LLTPMSLSVCLSLSCSLLSVGINRHLPLHPDSNIFFMKQRHISCP